MNKNKFTLITGVTGQYRAYLAEFLLKKAHLVHGLKQRTSLINTDLFTSNEDIFFELKLILEESK